MTTRRPASGISATLRQVAVNYSHCQKYVPMGLFIKSPSPPFVKGGEYEGLKVNQHTYGRNEHSRRARRSPLFQKGGQGGFYTVGHAL
jgi:hypothetical protein